MGKVNVWLKRALFVVLTLIAVVGLLVLGLTLFSHGHFHKDEEIQDIIGSLQILYAIAAVTLTLVAIGMYGACKENKWALIAFVVGIILSSLFLFGISIHAFAIMSQFTLELKSQYLQMLPLSNASEVIIEHLKEVQREFQCCGLEGFQDWGQNVSVSCLCDEDSVNTCVEHLTESPVAGEKAESTRIYADPCIPYLIDHFKDVIKTSVKILMGVSLLLVLSAVLSIVTLCQLNRKVEIPAVVYSQQAKAGNYISLSEVTEER